MENNKPIINISNDHDLLIRIDTRIMDMLKENREFKVSLATLQLEKSDKEDIKGRTEFVDRKFADIEIRMRKLEKVAYIAIAILGVLQALISIFVK